MGRISMEKIKKTACFLLALVGFASVGASVNSLTAKAEEFNVDSFQMVDGASVRYSASAQTEEERYADSGIRFHAVLPTSVYNQLEEADANSATVSVSYGMLIAPYTYLKDVAVFNEATVFGLNGDRKYCWAGDMVEGCTPILNITYSELGACSNAQYKNYHEIKGSITKILNTNYAREFVGMAYVKYQDGDTVKYDFAEYINNDAKNSARSAAYIAQIAADNKLDCAAALKGYYLDKVTTVATNYTVETYVGETLVKSETKATTIDQPVTVDAAAYDGFELVTAQTEGKAYANDRLVLKHEYKEIADSKYQIQNGGFETSDLTGWTLSGDIGAVSSQTHYWLNDEASAEGFAFGLDGTYMFSAYARDGLEGNRGVLQSSTFTVTKNGWITFKLGGAKNNTFVYVDVVEAETGNILKRYSNQNHRFVLENGFKYGCELNAYKANLAGLEGKEVYLRVSDNASGDFGLFFLDSVNTLYLAEPQGFTLAEEVAHQATIYELFNGNFDIDMNGWTKDGNIGAITESKTYWDPARPFYNEGKFFSCYTDGQGEDQRGWLRSSIFEIGGCGWISFRLGGMRNWDQVYVEVIDAATGEKIGQFYNERMIDCTLISYQADLSSFIGRTVYLNIVDNATGDYGLIFCDEFITYYAEMKDLPGYAKASNCLFNVANGSFEGGTLTGWTTESGTTGFVCGDTTYWADGVAMQDQNGATLELFHKEGDRFYHSNDGTKGALKSNVFTLAGDGIISFKLGGTNLDNCKVEICLENGEVIATVINNEFHDPRLAMGMLRRFVNLKNYVGQKVFIRVVDEKENGIGIVTIDSVVASMTMAEAQALLDSDKAAYENYRQDVLDSTAGMGEHAKAIVTIIQEYYRNLTIPTV